MQWSQWASGVMLGLRTAASQRLVADGAFLYSQKTDTCTEEEWERKTKVKVSLKVTSKLAHSAVVVIENMDVMSAATV